VILDPHTDSGKSGRCRHVDQPSSLAAGVSPFATSSIQSTAASDREKPVGPFWPIHHASVPTKPPARVISAMIEAGRRRRCGQ